MNRRGVQTVLGLVLLALIALIGSRQSYQANEHHDTLRAWFLDIGQGDSVLLDTPDGYQILIDGGPDDTVLTRLSEALPVSDHELNLVIVTHNHADHLTGINDVLEKYKVDDVWVSGASYDSATYRKFVGLLKSKNIRVETVQAGHQANFGALHATVLAPFKNWTGQTPQNPHDANVVTDWQYGQESILETGDAEMAMEEQMASLGELKPTDILKVGHHGSYTSTGDQLLQLLKPKIAIISVGTGNRYGHPHQSTLDRLAKYGIPVLRTDHDGTILCDITTLDFHCASQK